MTRSSDKMHVQQEVDDIATLSAIGVLAAMTSALAHEAIGHGGACIIRGGEVTLLSVIWANCAGGDAITDVAGPIGSLLAGLAGMAIVAWQPRSAVRARIFGLMLGSFALFWFAAQLVSDAFKAREDWVGAAAGAGLPNEWRPVAAITGIVVYGTVVRWVLGRALDIGGGAQSKRRFLVPYAAGVVALVACAALRPADGSALEAAGAVGLAPLGYVWAVTRLGVGRTEDNLKRSSAWIVTALICLVIYAALFGPGVGRLA